jgi:hypothetical protein
MSQRSIDGPHGSERASEGTVRFGPVRSGACVRLDRFRASSPFRVSRGASSSSLAGARRVFRRSVAACCGSVGWVGGRNEGVGTKGFGRWPRRHRMCPDRQSRTSTRLWVGPAWWWCALGRRRRDTPNGTTTTRSMGWDGLCLVEKSLDDRPPRAAAAAAVPLSRRKEDERAVLLSGTGWDNAYMRANHPSDDDDRRECMSQSHARTVALQFSSNSLRSYWDRCPLPPPPPASRASTHARIAHRPGTASTLRSDSTTHRRRCRMGPLDS